MDAKKAKELTNKHLLSLEGALKVIEANASDGRFSATFFNGITDEARIELMKRGFKFHLHTDVVNGYESYVCGWG